MSLRARLTLACGSAVFVALTVASLVVFVNVRSKLHDQIDVSLIQSAQNAAAKIAAAGSTGKLPPGTYPRANNPNYPAGPFLATDAPGYFQIIPSVGAISKRALGGGLSPPPAKSTTSPTSTNSETSTTSTRSSPASTPQKAPPLTVNSFVPLTERDELVATGLAAPYFREASYHGSAIRLYALRLTSSGDGLVRTARPLTEANATIGRVRWLLIALTLGGAAAAALLGRLAAAAVLRPVRSLAVLVQDVAITRDLGQRIPTGGRDEVASLAKNFNTMLAALEESLRAQQQLIADASHELRTPLTAHRANVELLARPDLPLARRPGALRAAVRGIEELSTLVDDLIQAAREGKPVDARAPVALDQLVARAIERAKRRAPDLRFHSALEPCTVAASATRLERAIDNVLDNAIKWSSPGGSIEIDLASPVLTIRDHGPGIEPADLPHVFDRFYRSPAARGKPGSGLGLAIVKRTVEDHLGTVAIENHAGDGVIVTFRFDALRNL